MATWQQRGATTPIQLWDPDYSFLTKVYSVQQARYDKGFNQVKSVYNSLLNGALTNESNEAYRSEVFKRLEETLKSTATLDLSQSENISKAIGLLDPVSKDEDIAYDLGVTRFHNQEKTKMEGFRNSTDPKQRAMYNDYSAMAISYAENDLRNARRGDGSITAVKPEKFVPFEDINAYLNKAATDLGLEIKMSRTDPSGYIVTDKNGRQAIPSFTIWANQQMGNRFDSQINLIGKVQAESAIRGLMKSEGISRNDAVHKISERLAPEYTKTKVKETIELNRSLQNIEDEIKIIEDNYEQGIPDEMPKLQKRYEDLKYQRDHYDTLLLDDQDKLDKLEKEGTGYLAQNIYSVFSDEARAKTALGWATTTAMVTADREIKPDQVWITKQNNAIKLKIHADDMKYKAADLNLKKQRLELDTWKAMNDGEGTGKNKSVSGEAQKQSLLGLNTTSTKASVEILQKRDKQNRNKSWSSITKANTGLMNFIIPKGDYNMALGAMNKIKQIADGDTNVTFSDSEVKFLSNYGEKIGYEVFDARQWEGSPEKAVRAMLAVSGGTYEAAQSKLDKYRDTGVTSDYVRDNLQEFTNTLSSLKSLREDEEAIERSQYNISQVITDGTGAIKDVYAGAKIMGYNDNGVPIYDLSKVSDAGKNQLDAVVAREFEYLTAPTGQSWNYTGLSAGELEALTNSNMASAYDEDGDAVNLNDLFGDLTNLPKAQLSELFSDEMEVSYDVAGENAVIELKVNPTSSIAKTLDKDVPEKITVELPYETIKANSFSLPRLLEGLKNNTASVEGAGRFAPFLKNPNSRVQSDSYMDAAGFKYDMIGTELSNGSYGLNVITNHWDIIKEEWVENSFEMPINDPSSPLAYNDINDKINLEFERYIATIGMTRDALMESSE